MYEVDSRDSVVELNETPRPDIGAPLPQVLATEQCLVIAYLSSRPAPGWNGRTVQLVSPESDGLPITIINFARPFAHLFGPPNDEAFSGHPLAARGVSPYAAFEVNDSSWVRAYERMNSVHRLHRRDWFMAHKRHFIFAFHDSTFECIAGGFSASTFTGSMRSAWQAMAAVGAG